MTLTKHSLKRNPTPATTSAMDMLRIALGNLTDEETLRLRHEIDVKLNIDVRKLNLSDELGLMLRKGQILLDTVINDPATPANQKSQVFNTVQGQLEQIVKMRGEVLNQERLKKYEIAFMKSLEAYPNEDVRAQFMQRYGEYLDELIE